MVVVLCQEAQRDRGYRIVAPGTIETTEQGTALLQNTVHVTIHQGS